MRGSWQQPARHLLVIALDQDFGLGRHFERDSLRRLEHDRVRKTQGQVQVLAGQRGAIADADEFKLALVTFADTRRPCC